MKNQQLNIETSLQIDKSAHEVFEAIVQPEKMKNYFISRSSGKMEEGKQITWGFPEFEEDFPIRVGKIEKDSYISFYWTIDGHELMVEISLAATEDGATIVSVTEKSRENDTLGIQWLKLNTAGWANFLACLKAYLEYGINLRKRAFDFLKS